MAFGFPAHYETACAEPAGPQPRAAVREALRALTWRVTGEDEHEGGYEVRASAGINWASWGERITVRADGGGSLMVSSRCASPLQCVDWGRNRFNVERVVAALRQTA